MSNIDFADIADNAKLAREATLVGKYDDAVVYYGSVIQQINRHMTQSKDKQKCQEVKEVF